MQIPPPRSMHRQITLKFAPPPNACATSLYCITSQEVRGNITVYARSNLCSYTIITSSFFFQAVLLT